jgi:hypothetical protein
MEKRMFRMLLNVSIIITLAIQFASITEVLAYHEDYYRSLGIGFNDYDKDGRTCAATDYQADMWSDLFYDHHEISTLRTAHYQDCEEMEASYAGLPDPGSRNHGAMPYNPYTSLYPNEWQDSFCMPYCN